MLSNRKYFQEHKQTIYQLVDEQHNIMRCPQFFYVILSEQRFDVLEYCVWFSFSASVQVFM